MSKLGFLNIKIDKLIVFLAFLICGAEIYVRPLTSLITCIPTYYLGIDYTPHTVLLLYH